MLKSLEIQNSISTLKAEITQGISANLDMKSQAEELEALMDEYKATLELENRQKSNIKESVKMTNDKKEFLGVIKSLLTGKTVSEQDRHLMPKVVDAAGNYVNEDAPEKGAYLVPEEMMNLLELNPEEQVLEGYVDVVQVSAPTGKFPIVDYSQELELVDFDNDNEEEIASKSLAFGQLPYAVGNKGVLVPVARSLMQDANADVLAIVGKMLGKAEIRATNKGIVAEAQKDGVKTITNSDFDTVQLLDDIKTALLAKLRVADSANAKIFVGQTDFGRLSNLKDEEGRYYVQPSVTDAQKLTIDGIHEIVVVEDTVLPTGKVIVGSFKNIKKIVRVGYEVMSDASAGFKTNTIIVRAIARFQIKNTNPNAFVVISE